MVSYPHVRSHYSYGGNVGHQAPFVGSHMALAPPETFSSYIFSASPEQSPRQALPSLQVNKKKQTRKSSKRMSERHYVNHNYHDHLHDEDPIDRAPPVIGKSGKPRGPKGGVSSPFPEKLYKMLQDTAKEGLSDIVSWQPHGRSFAVRQPKQFVEQILPRFFKQTKMTSFQRQLNLYGFVRLTSGLDRGTYYHELFLRGRPTLCKRIARTRVKGNGSKAASSPDTEPNFYKMEFCKDDSSRPDAAAAAAAKIKVAVGARRDCKEHDTVTKDVLPTVSAASSVDAEQHEADSASCFGSSESTGNSDVSSQLDCKERLSLSRVTSLEDLSIPIPLSSPPLAATSNQLSFAMEEPWSFSRSSCSSPVLDGKHTVSLPALVSPPVTPLLGGTSETTKPLFSPIKTLTAAETASLPLYNDGDASVVSTDAELRDFVEDIFFDGDDLFDFGTKDNTEMLWWGSNDN